ncbi:DUF4405 domain-containing protein [Campylobacter hyointestinalis subsp. hyointestinalis]|uniref:cytochrome b/b6 domain-containing protein n=2 Tax=Campylobacter hyointestinalis TaxID=198 RepID=UPI000724047E|nr:cytochrome b/b6 domain-containing protein [Campylobacter hyointestinalis]QCU00220.1 DUF4405 domain-containing protein [Campylobacter hyointestinalis subsp. hyointestinalis]CUU87943.1 nickel-dependent hydrogenases B-type cytochrome subunit family protein [Campylobacter hyointestinalis subsp. hyointestinalis]
MIKSYIWSFGARFSHIVLIFSFIISYILSEFDSLLYFHAAFGVVFGVAVIFRIVWGFIGTKHSKFSDFKFYGLMAYFRSFFGKKEKFIGHNPASSIAIIIMLSLGFVCAVSGLMLYAIDKNSGIFAFLYDSYSELKFVKSIHEVSANLLLIVAIIHICGALIDKLIHKNDALNSMITGYKLTKNDESVRANLTQKIFCLVWILAIIATFLYILNRDNFILKSHALKVDYSSQNAVFAKECGSCHMLYPPFLLPKKSWGIMMSGLENHFGTDASIDDDTNKNILNFLVANSAQTRGDKTAFNILKYAKNDQNIAITQNEYWIKKHRKIDEKVFLRKDVKSKANCVACHKEIENGIIGLIDYEKIK